MVEIKISGTIVEIERAVKEFSAMFAAVEDSGQDITTVANHLAKKPARQRAAKSTETVTASVPEPRVEPAPKVEAPAPAQKQPEKVEEAPASAVPSDAEVQKYLVAVNDKFGIDKAIECLTKFGVKRGRELTDVQKAPFVELCKSVIG